MTRLDALPRRARTSPGVRARGRDESRHDPDAPFDRHSPEGSHRRAPLPRTLEGLRVVVVDDDETTVEFFATALGLCGAAVTTAMSAVEALGLVTTVRPNVVVSVLAMAGEDGYWLIHAIRQLPEPALRAMPVIAATAYGREHSRARAVAAGFIDHLQKPVDPEVLCQVVAKAAGR